MPDLLLPDEPSPVATFGESGPSPFFLTCDHAGRDVPRRLGRLGLPDSEFERHIAWDVGASATSRLLADALGATLVEQRYSRLVIDCNRPPSVQSSIPPLSERTEIPGNRDLSEAEARLRIEEVFRPYHERIEALLDARRAAGRPTILVAMHSFTPVFMDERRPWHIGTLYGRDGRLAAALRPALEAEERYVVGDNQPYSVSDESDYTIPVHGEARGLVHVGLEVRQDLITTAKGQQEWAAVLARRLPEALARLG